MTTRDKIVEIAKSNPFFKIVEIAELAGTTERYVRTVLSEENFGLAEKRKEEYMELVNIIEKNKDNPEKMAEVLLEVI